MENKLKELESRVEFLEKQLKGFLKIQKAKGKKVQKKYTELQFALSNALRLLENGPDIVKEIYFYILEVNEIKIDDMFLLPNKRAIQQCRNEIHYLIRLYLNSKSNYYKGHYKIDLSTDQIGYLTGRDHATVLHSCEVVENDIFNFKDYRSKILMYKSAISEKINMFFNKNKDVL